MLNILPIAYLHDKLKLSLNYTKLKLMNDERFHLLATVTAMFIILSLVLLYAIAVSLIRIRHEMKNICQKENVCKVDTTKYSVIQGTPVVGHKVKPLQENGQHNVVVKTWPTGNKSAYCK
jgi:hypothetical protein